MEYGNGRATMIELDMLFVLYLGDFLSKGSRESFEQNILFRLSPPRKGRKSRQARPGPHLKAAAKAGLAASEHWARTGQDQSDGSPPIHPLAVNASIGTQAQI